MPFRVENRVAVLAQVRQLQALHSTLVSPLKLGPSKRWLLYQAVDMLLFYKGDV